MNKIKLALADHHTMVRKSIAMLIESFGNYIVDIDANNGRQLFEHIEKSDSPPDICVLEVNMPVMNGFDTAVAIKKKWPQIKILALSSFDNEVTVIRMLASGASGYLVKSNNTEELKEALHKLYTDGYYYTDILSSRHFHSIIRRPGLALSFKEKELLLLSFSCTEMTYAEIAKEIGVSVRSVEAYRDRLFQKLGVKNRVGLALFAFRLGLCQLY